MIKGFHREGRRLMMGITGVFIIVCLLMSRVDWPIIIEGLLVLTAFVFLVLFYQFFRVPNRTPLVEEGAIVSPCDGKVVVIEEVEETEFLKCRCRQISIFMSPLNVHINWFPIAGRVLYSAYHPGKFLVAWHPKSSTDNERTTVVVEGSKGRVLMRQIAGAVARRIVCYAKEGDTALQSGEMGFIKFGSRVDVFVPLDAEITVDLDEVVKGTQTVLARW